MSEYRIDIFRGDNRTLEVTVLDTNGNPVDLTGAQIKFTARTKIDRKKVIEKSSTDPAQITITDAANGKYEIYLIPSDTYSLKPGKYVFDSQVTLSSGQVYTVVFGTIEVKPDVTR